MGFVLCEASQVPKQPYNSFVIRHLRVFLRDRLTSGGRMLFYLILLANGIGGISTGMKIYVLAVALVSLGLMSMVAAYWSRVRLTLDFSLPTRVTKGRPFRAQVALHNSTSRSARDVEVALIDRWPTCKVDYRPKSERSRPDQDLYHTILPDSCWVGDLQPDMQTRVEWDVTFDTRGTYTFGGVRQATSFPWGFWRAWYDIDAKQTVLVYPEFRPLEQLDIPVGRRYQPGGIALSSNLGDSTEFVSTREFREGDSLRVIHWPSWARTGKPIVKEFQEEFFCRIAVVLDTFLDKPVVRYNWRGRRVGPAEPRRQEFEQVVSLAAAVADQLAREEYVIDLFAAGPELYQLQAGRSLAHFENVMDILACVEPCYDPPFEKVEPVLLDSLESITTTIVILLDWCPARSRLVQAIRDRGTGVKVILVRNDDSPPKSGDAAKDAAEIEGLVGPFVTLTSEQLQRGVTSL